MNTDNQFTKEREDSLSAISVGELNLYVKSLLEGDGRLNGIFVKGEISNFKNHRQTGHFYFTLKDEKGAIAAVMFRSCASKLKFIPENGMRVVIRGRVSLFPASGTYQLYVESMEPDGVGALYIAYEQLRRRLEAEGLFREDIKRPLPKIPSCVGVITSPTGAAVQDILNVLGRRFPFAKILVYPALVQGESAVPSLLAGVAYFSQSKKADVVIIGRGGGSIEDLWAFNSEDLARAVRACSVPVISAVGHETDFTICDFVADRRAPTPSAAAECAVPTTEELITKFENVTKHLRIRLQKELEMKRAQLLRYASSKALTNPQAYLDEKRLQLDHSAEKLEFAMQKSLQDQQSRFAYLTGRLETLNPMAVISRGYSAGFTSDRKVLKSVKQVSVGDAFTLRMTDGTLHGQVLELEHSDLV